MEHFHSPIGIVVTVCSLQKKKKTLFVYLIYAVLHCCEG